MIGAAYILKMCYPKSKNVYITQKIALAVGLSISLVGWTIGSSSLNISFSGYEEVIGASFVTLLSLVVYFVKIVSPVIHGRTILGYGVFVYLQGELLFWSTQQKEIYGINFSESTFWILILVASCLYLISPVSTALKQSWWFIFYRWRLQRAFYSKETKGKCGCNGIFSCYPSKTLKDSSKTLEDGESPNYICVTVANGWRLDANSEPWHLYTLQKNNMGRTLEKGNPKTTGEKVYPLSFQMAVSASALGYNNGKVEISSSFRVLQSVLGVGLGSWFDHRTPENYKKHFVIWLVLHVLVSACFIAGSISQLYYGDGGLAVVIAMVIVLLLWVISMLPFDKLRSFMLHYPFVRTIHRILDVDHIGEEHPDHLYATDGGHGENMALIPLLKEKCSTIIIVDGSEDGEDKCEELLYSLDYARHSFFNV